MASFPEAQQRVRVVAQRGKSMEELGASKLTGVSALSKSSEQLDQLSRHSTGPGGSDGDKRNVSFFAEVREAKGQERGRKKQYLLNEVEKESEMVGQRNTPGKALSDTQKNSLLKQNSEPAIGSEEEAVPLTPGTRTPCRSTSPASHSSSRARVHSASPRLQSLVTEEFRSSKPPIDTSDPPSPRDQETSEREIKSTSSTPTQIKLPCENK